MKVTAHHVMLSSFNVPRKTPSVKTDYIHPKFEISSREFTQIMWGGGNTIEILANKCLDLDRACYKYFLGTGKSFVMNCYEFKIHSYVTYIC